MSLLLALAILVFSWMYLQYFRPQPQSRTQKSGTLNSTPLEEGIVTRHDVRVDLNSTTEKSGVVEKPTHSHPSALAGNIDVESSSEELEEISPESINIAIFCALAYEAVAVKLILDEEYSCHLKGTGPKKYVYSFGRIAKHRIVIARPHQMGSVEAAHCATAVSQQFPNVRFALMVGIGAGIPNYPKHDIRLGDIAVSIPQDSHPGVIQYDFGKYERGRFILKGCLNKPPPILISADGSLVEDELMGRSPLTRILRKITQVQSFARPNTNDILFDEHFHHVTSCSDCSGCEQSSERKLVSRQGRQSEQPVVHRGLILSGNGVVKDTSGRAILRRDNKDAICFEMEAAGIMDEIPCLIVRGICDYADTHKNDSWHHYAAAVAAAYCKALLRKVDSQDVEETRSMSELFEGMKGLSKGVSDLRDAQRATEDVVDNLHQKFLTETLRPIKEASFDSYTNADEGKCLQGTRTEILSEIAQWGESTSSSKFIFWLNGMAGTGKSTISRTVAASLNGQGILGACFFFKKGAGDQGNARRLFSTIAWQLAFKEPRLEPYIMNAIQKEPDVSEKSPREQYNCILLKPLRELEQQNQTERHLVIIIDALDECDDERDTEVILQLLPELKQFKTLKLRFLLTSRPSVPTVLGFRNIQGPTRQDLILHEIPNSVIQRDISLFLRHRLSAIRHKRSLPEDWPGDDKIDSLVTFAVPLFIFAATVCRFLEDLKWSPEERLDEFLADPATKSASEMDRTYLPILNQLLTGRNQAESTKLREEFHQTIGVIILLSKPLSVNALTRFIRMNKYTVATRVGSFGSILSVPDDMDAPVRPLHLSFRDFLVNTDSPYRVEEAEMHSEIASHCFWTMKTSLKHNICDLKSYGILREDIGNLSVAQHLSPELQYSCRYWIHHVQRGRSLLPDAEILAFFQMHFLHWLEAMSLLGAITEAVEMMEALERDLNKSPRAELADFLHDARKFLNNHVHVINIAPLQLYCAGLVFSPSDSIIRRAFEAERPAWIRTLPHLESAWSPELRTLTCHSDYLWSVAFSPDGRMVASASSDRSMKLWDSRTGISLRTMTGHADRVFSVAFSPNGRLIVSGSHDKTVKIWDVITGLELWTFTGHSHPVKAVSFSPDGRTVASSSLGPIRVCDVKTGTEVQTLIGHAAGVSCVAFSPNGALIASGSNDNSIKIWDAATGVELSTITGHSKRVRSLSFSPDSSAIASASEDKTIIIWDIKTGNQLQTLTGHRYTVSSVAFSPDGRLMASGSQGDGVKIWNTKTGTELQTLRTGDFNQWDYSVAFSPDGLVLASGSTEGTITFWDTTASVGNLQSATGHSGEVHAVDVSPDGQIVGSTSADKSIKLWDAETGTELHTLKGHGNRVLSIAFSSTRPILVSGSIDNSLRLWDTRNGMELQSLSQSGYIWTVAFSPDGQTVASGSTKKTLTIWNTSTGRSRTLLGHAAAIWSVAFSPDGRIIASSSDDRTIKLWDAKSGVELHTLQRDTHLPSPVAFIPDTALSGEQILASGSKDDTIKLWDARSGMELQTLSAYACRSYAYPLWSIAFSGDGPFVVSGRHPGIAKTNDWVVRGTERVLWLPFSHRNYDCSAMNRGTLALGFRDGRVFFIRICPSTD